MSNQSTIKSLLEVKINEMINSIQRRISLNVQMIHPAYLPVKREEPSLTSSRGDSGSDNKVGKAIADCNHTLNKLFFLKSALTEIAEEDGVYFLDNYHLFSFDDFCAQLSQRSYTPLK